MILFSTSVAGSNRIAIEDKAARIAKQHGKKLRIINLVDQMLKVAEELNRDITPFHPAQP